MNPDYNSTSKPLGHKGPKKEPERKRVGSIKEVKFKPKAIWLGECNTILSAILS